MDKKRPAARHSSSARPPTHFEEVFAGKTLGTLGSLKLRKSLIAPPLPEGKVYHVFFSCHDDPVNTKWVKKTAIDLESDHYRYKCCVPERDFVPGKLIQENVYDCVLKSTSVVAVLSQQYIKNDWNKFDATYVKSKKHNSRIVPVVIDETQVPASLSNYATINCRRDKRRWWKRLINGIRGNAPDLPEGKKDHVFIAHGRSPQDKQWVKDTLALLESAEHGLRCTASDRNFTPGMRKSYNIIKCIDDALIVLVVLSQSFILDEWQTYREGVTKQGVRMIPVLTEDITLPLELEELSCLDATEDTNMWQSQLIKILLCDDAEDKWDTQSADSELEKDQTEKDQKSETNATGPQVPSNISSDDKKDGVDVDVRAELHSGPFDTLTSPESIDEDETLRKEVDDREYPVGTSMSEPVDTPTKAQQQTPTETQSIPRATVQPFKSTEAQPSTEIQPNAVTPPDVVIDVEETINISQVSEPRHYHTLTHLESLPHAKQNNKRSFICCRSEVVEDTEIKSLLLLPTDELVIVESNGQNQFTMNIRRRNSHQFEPVFLGNSNEPQSLSCFGRDVFINCSMRLSTVNLDSKTVQQLASVNISNCICLEALNSSLLAISESKKIRFVNLNDGEVVGELAVPEERHSGALPFTSISKSKNGNLIAVAYRADKVFSYAPSGPESDTYSETCLWRKDIPKPVSVSTDSQNYIFILSADRAAAHLWILSEAGEVLNTVSLKEHGILFPKHISCGEGGKIAVSHGTSWLHPSRVTIFTLD